MKLIDYILLLLGITITPGTILGDGTKWTRVLLNLLGLPTAALDDSEVTTAKINNKAVTPAKLSDETRAGLNGLKNKVMNGNFDFARRNNAVNNPANGTFPFDRWRIFYDGAGATHNTGVLASNSVGYAQLEDFASQAFRWLQTVAPAGESFRYLEQRIENARTFGSQNVTLSFFATITAGTSYVVEVVRNYGTGGSPSVQEVLYTTPIPGTSGWTKQELTFAMTSVQGKSFGTNGDHFLAVRFKMPINSTFDFYLVLVQLELGSVASAFEQRGQQIERFLCARYFHTNYSAGKYADDSDGTGAVAHMFTRAADDARGTLIYPVEMRAAPTVTLYAPQGGAGAGSVRDLMGGDITGVVALNSGARGFLGVAKTAAFTAGHLHDFHYTSDAEL